MHPVGVLVKPGNAEVRALSLDLHADHDGDDGRREAAPRRIPVGIRRNGRGGSDSVTEMDRKLFRQLGGQPNGDRDETSAENRAIAKIDLERLIERIGANRDKVTDEQMKELKELCAELGEDPQDVMILQADDEKEELCADLGEDPQDLFPQGSNDETEAGPPSRVRGRRTASKR